MRGDVSWGRRSDVRAGQGIGLVFLGGVVVEISDGGRGRLVVEGIAGRRIGRGLLAHHLIILSPRSRRPREGGWGL